MSRGTLVEVARTFDTDFASLSIYAASLHHDWGEDREQNYSFSLLVTPPLLFLSLTFQIYL